MKKLMLISLIILLALSIYGINASELGMLYGYNVSAETAIRTGFSTYTMATQYKSIAGRFTARSTKDVKSIIAAFSSTSSPGTIECRIETIDASTGLPTGTLYDANATVSATPTTGTNTFTFATLPTTGLVVGTEYAVVLQQTVGGTTATLIAYSASSTYSLYPAITLTNADYRTPANYTETGSKGSPGMVIVLEDDTIADVGFNPYGSTTSPTAFAIYSADRFISSKIITNVPMVVEGISIGSITRTGTPAGDIRLRILDTSNNLITGADVTLPKNSLTGAGTYSLRGYFPTAVTLPAGTYRCVVSSVDSADSSNCWKINYIASTLSALAVPTSGRYSYTTDAGANWTDGETITYIYPVVSSIPAVSSSGSSWFISH